MDDAPTAGAAPADVPPLVTKDDAARVLAAIVELRRQIADVQGELGRQVASAQAAAEELTRPLIDRADALEARLEGWAVQNRDTLFPEDCKQLRLTTGRVGFKRAAPAVVIADEEVLVKHLRDQNLTELLSTTTKPDKKALLKRLQGDEPLELPGTTVRPGAEFFYFEPLAVPAARLS